MQNHKFVGKLGPLKISLCFVPGVRWAYRGKVDCQTGADLAMGLERAMNGSRVAIPPWKPFPSHALETWVFVSI